jgi:Ca2+-binding EF-hand superfamily protein
MFKANDKNKDGKLAKEEFSVVARSYGFGDKVEAVFPQADKNKDAFLQEAEFLTALDAGNKLSTQVVTAAPPVTVINGSPGALPANAPPEIKVLMNFKANDANKDGKLSKSEYQALAKAQTLAAAQADSVWTSVNKDKDAFITEAELAASLSSQPGMQVVRRSGAPDMESFKANDKNKDGKLSKEEFQAMAKSLGAPPGGEEGVWNIANTDKDNFISEAEMKAIIARSGGGGAPTQASGGVPAAAATDEQRFAAFKAQDKNKDGKLAKAEYAEVLKTLGFADQLETLWPQRDANKDGFITEAEFKNAIGGGVQVTAAPRSN